MPCRASSYVFMQDYTVLHSHKRRQVSAIPPGTNSLSAVCTFLYSCSTHEIVACTHVNANGSGSTVMELNTRLVQKKINRTRKQQAPYDSFSLITLLQSITWLLPTGTFTMRPLPLLHCRELAHPKFCRRLHNSARPSKRHGFRFCICNRHGRRRSIMCVPCMDFQRQQKICKQSR